MRTFYFESWNNFLESELKFKLNIQFAIISKDNITCYKNNNWHNENGPAEYYKFGNRKEYWLYGEFFGSNELDDNKYIESDKYWQRLCKLRCFG